MLLKYTLLLFDIDLYMFIKFSPKILYDDIRLCLLQWSDIIAWDNIDVTEKVPNVGCKNAPR